MVWFNFIAVSVLLVFFSFKLCKQGIILSEKTNISAGFIGVIFLAIATSCPEITTAVASVSLLGKIGLGYGDITGSIVFNFMIILLVDLFSGGDSVFGKITKVNKKTAVFLFAAAAIVLGASFLRKNSFNIPAYRGVGSEGFIICLLYAAGIWKAGGKSDKTHTRKTPAAREIIKLWIKFIFFLAVVIAFGIMLTWQAGRIVSATNLSETFIGMIFLGVVTSLPEFIVTIAALSVGSVDMALGNILGSNLFDICIVPILDIFNGFPLLGALNGAQMISSFLVVLVSGVFVLGARTRERVIAGASVFSWLIFSIGFIGFVLIYFI